MTFTTPKHPQTQSRLMSLPLELRHKIYDELNFRGHWEERRIFRDYLDINMPRSGHSDNAGQIFRDETETGSFTFAGKVASDSDDPGIVDEEQYPRNPLLMEYGAPSTLGSAYRRRTMWRCVPYIVYPSACPPTPATMSICQRIHDEVNAHYYDANTLHINATKAVWHQNCFDMVLRRLSETPSPPIASFQKVLVRIEWDSEYINDLGEQGRLTDPEFDELPDMGEVLQTCLRARISTLANALQSCTHLRQLTVRLHDSMYTVDAASWHDQLLWPLMMLSAQKHAELNLVNRMLGESHRPLIGDVFRRFRAMMMQMTALYPDPA